MQLPAQFSGVWSHSLSTEREKVDCLTETHANEFEQPSGSRLRGAWSYLPTVSRGWRGKYGCNRWSFVNNDQLNTDALRHRVEVVGGSGSNKQSGERHDNEQRNSPALASSHEHLISIRPIGRSTGFNGVTDCEREFTVLKMQHNSFGTGSREGVEETLPGVQQAREYPAALFVRNEGVLASPPCRRLRGRIQVTLIWL